jgi:hypothetical protein
MSGTDESAVGAGRPAVGIVRSLRAMPSIEQSGCHVQLGGFMDIPLDRVSCGWNPDSTGRAELHIRGHLGPPSVYVDGL